MQVLEKPAFAVHDVVFYVGTGVGIIKGIEESELSDPAVPPMYTIQPNRSDMIIRAPLTSKKIISIKTFAGDDPQKLVRDILSKSPESVRRAQVRWSPKMKRIEDTLAKTDSFATILTAARNLSRPIDDEYPTSFIAPQRWLKGIIIDTLAAVLDKDTEAVLKSVNAILNHAGRLAFPD